MSQRVSNIGRRGKQLDMRLISSRTIAYPDSQSLTPTQAREALFRINNERFVLYLTDGYPSSTAEERVISLDLREALIWLNEPGQSAPSWT
jgi:hypothetical protein